MFLCADLGALEACEARRGVALDLPLAPPQGLPPDVAAMWSSPKMLKMAVPLQRKGTPDEAAGAVLMLASPYASYITGATLECTGGMGI